MKAHFSQTTVLARLEQCPRMPESCVVELRRGDSAWDPQKTSGRPLRGPAKLVYIRYPDGGIDCHEHSAGDDVEYASFIGDAKPVAGEFTYNPEGA